jgi:hypothetical protein
MEQRPPKVQKEANVLQIRFDQIPEETWLAALLHGPDFILEPADDLFTFFDGLFPASTRRLIM